MAPPKTTMPVESSGIRLAELVAALSLATDLGTGQPLEFALCSCVLSVRLGDALGMPESALRDVYYQALLRYIGCTAETHLLAAIVGDELSMRRDFSSLDTADTSQIMSLFVRYIREANAGASPLQLARMVVTGVAGMPAVKASFAGHCEVAQRLAERLGFGESVLLGLGQLYERWDGKGSPRGLKGEIIAPAVRVVTLAQDAIIFQRLGGIDSAIAVIKERRGAAYDPWMADRICRDAEQLMAGLDGEPSWEEVLSLEPGARPRLSDEQFDAACRAMADFTDMKSSYTLGHSSGVADLAASAAHYCGLPAVDVMAVRRAALLHDVGRVGVSTSIWDKQGPLSSREWEKVRMHPYYTERVLARPAILGRLGRLGSMHHERLDGSGYHRGATAAMLPPLARILSAADAYHAMTEPRPHRPPMEPEQAAYELSRDVRAGRLDGDAVSGVLAAAGHKPSSARREMVAGLSAREVEVLRLVARGHSMKEIAEVLTISRKTVDHHIQHIYTKIGVSTRAAATLFALEQDLIRG